MVVQRLLVIALCIGLMGCSVKRVGYTAVGAAAGAGIGYSYHNDTKEAAIGGVAGGTAGAILATVQENTENKKYKAGYEKGYNQSKVDTAVQNWDDNTGKCAHNQKNESKHLVSFKVPQREQDNVVYESHYVTLEDYR